MGEGQADVPVAQTAREEPVAAAGRAPRAAVGHAEEAPRVRVCTRPLLSAPARRARSAARAYPVARGFPAHSISDAGPAPVELRRPPGPRATAAGHAPHLGRLDGGASGRHGGHGANGLRGGGPPPRPSVVRTRARRAGDLSLELADRADATGSSAGPERPPPQLQGPVRLPHERDADGPVRTRHHAVRPREDGVLRARGLRARHVSARRRVAAAVELAGRVHDGGDALRLPATHDPGGVRSAGRRGVWSPGRRRAGERVPERSASHPGRGHPPGGRRGGARRPGRDRRHESALGGDADHPVPDRRHGRAGFEPVPLRADPAVPQAPRRAAYRLPRDPGGVA